MRFPRPRAGTDIDTLRSAVHGILLLLVQPVKYAMLRRYSDMTENFIVRKHARSDINQADESVVIENKTLPINLNIVMHDVIQFVLEPKRQHTNDVSVVASIELMQSGTECTLP